jgi:transposase-like protein
MVKRKEVKRKEKISDQLKEQILAKLFDSNCVVSVLSKSYGISRSTLYKWRYMAKDKDTLFAADSQKQFVELSVSEPNNNGLKGSSLQKASLVFNDFSIFIEGKVSNSKFISILKILEEPC